MLYALNNSSSKSNLRDYKDAPTDMNLLLHSPAGSYPGLILLGGNLKHRVKNKTSSLIFI